MIEVIEALQNAATLNILHVNGFRNDLQLKILKRISELRPKNAHILTGITSVADLESFVQSITDPCLQTFSEGAKIDNIVVLDFKQRELNERGTALARMFESFADRSVPHAWDLMLKLKNFENIAYGNLTPLIRAIVCSPVGVNLSLPTLVLDHVSTRHIMTKLKEAFLTDESKVKVLDVEGSQLSDDGLEQLAQLAESRKPFEKVRLTGMQIPSAITGRLGMLRSVGINMAGCNVNAADLTDMVAGWLGEGSILRGVDMRGNEVNETIVRMFLEKGFNGYGDQRSGFMFVKS